MSAVAADIVAADINEKQAAKDEYVLGLATGNSPTGLYKHLAKAFNAGPSTPAGSAPSTSTSTWVFRARTRSSAPCIRSRTATS